MTEINKSQITPYTTRELYELVNHVDAYPEFIPHCLSSEAVEISENAVRATLTLGYKGLEKSFTTLNQLEPFQKITMRLVDGPFKYLEGFWTFVEKNNAQSEIHLKLNFEFSSFLLSAMFGPIFHQVANRLVDAFCERAKIIYGERV